MLTLFLLCSFPLSQHYLPVVATLNTPSSAPLAEAAAPPPDTLTEPAPPSLTSKLASAVSDAAASVASTLTPSAAQNKWTLSARRGHTAMVSGIKSLSSTHQQLVIGWTGPVSLTPAEGGGDAADTDEETLAGAQDIAALEGELEAFDAREGEGRVKNVPVWLDKDVAKGHYEGYCKTSASPPLLRSRVRRWVY